MPTMQGDEFSGSNGLIVSIDDALIYAKSTIDEVGAANSWSADQKADAYGDVATAANAADAAAWFGSDPVVFWDTLRTLSQQKLNTSGWGLAPNAAKLAAVWAAAASAAGAAQEQQLASSPANLAAGTAAATAGQLAAPVQAVAGASSKTSTWVILGAVAIAALIFSRR